MKAFEWLFAEPDRATAALTLFLAALVYAGHKLIEHLTFLRDAKLEAAQDQAIANVSEIVEVAPEPTLVLPLIPMQRVTNGDDLLGGGIR